MSSELVDASEPSYWHQRISERWQQSVEAIVDVGRLLIEAKEALPHGQFLTLFEGENRLAFGRLTANRLMTIARDPRLSNVSHGIHLPASWRTLYELSRLDDDSFEAGLESGAIHAEMQRWEVAPLRKAPEITTANQETEETTLPWPPSKPSFTRKPLLSTCTVSELETLLAKDTKFGTLYADPPWPYDNQGTRAATENHYTAMTLEDIAALPLAPLAAEKSHLHLWTTNAFLFEAKAILDAWGFEYKSCFIWTKPQMGIGNYWRVSHEFLLLGVRGNCPFQDHAQISYLQAPRGQHSAKPEQVREIIELVSPAPRLELFARRISKGWCSWGNEIDRTLFDQQAAELS